jgi:hypothetical protein
MATEIKGIRPALLSALVVAIETFTAGMATVTILSETTNSGLLGFCGP